MEGKPPKLWCKQYRRGEWRRDSLPEGWSIVSTSTMFIAAKYQTRKWDVGPKPNFKKFKTPFYSRKYYYFKNLGIRYDPFKYKGRPVPSSERQEMVQKDELFEDYQPTHTWSSEYKSFAELHLPGALASLTTMQRQVYRMKHEDRMYMTDIAKELGICRSAAHRRYQRARQRIKKYLEKIHAEQTKCTKM